MYVQISHTYCILLPKLMQGLKQTSDVAPLVDTAAVVDRSIRLRMHRRPFWTLPQFLEAPIIVLFSLVHRSAPLITSCSRHRPPPTFESSRRRGPSLKRRPAHPPVVDNATSSTTRYSNAPISVLFSLLCRSATSHAVVGATWTETWTRSVHWASTLGL